MMRLHNARLRNFKAIVDSKTVRLGSLTVFIGQNGAGKSSLIEGLQTYQSIVRDGLDTAMQRWLGIEHALHKSQTVPSASGNPVQPKPMQFEFGMGDGRAATRRTLSMSVESDFASNSMRILDERIGGPSRTWHGRDPAGAASTYGAGRSLLSAPLSEDAVYAASVLDWQFLTMSPERMGLPVPQQRTEGGVRLAPDGSNVADFLRDLRRLDLVAFDDIVRTMSYVLPYAKDIRPALTSELERKSWIEMAEADYKVPGWLLSTGTLRMLALLGLLRHPRPPALIVVEEIENGLDPRSIHLIVEEIRNAVTAGVTQVIATTHSPYLLDLLQLDHLVLVDRDAKGHPRFTRPSKREHASRWAKEFAPGHLYTMGRLGEPS